jgi:hypothetical protein
MMSQIQQSPSRDAQVTKGMPQATAKGEHIRRDSYVITDSRGSAIEAHLGATGGMILASSVAQIHVSMPLRRLRVRLDKNG